MNPVHKADWAMAQEVSMNTVRTQLKSVFAKLGIRRQAELHRVLGMTSLLNSSSQLNRVRRLRGWHL
jgi:hypothetical protein